MVQVTAFAAVFVAVLFSQTMSLSGLVIVSTVLQATAVFNVPIDGAGAKGVVAYGVSPYTLMALVVGIVWLVRVVQDRGIKLQQHLRLPFGLFAAYAVVAIVGSFVLPRWFDGLPVNLLVEVEGINQLAPLRASLSNPVQALNLCVHGGVLLFMLQAFRQHDGPKGLRAGVAGALVLVLVLGFYQQLATKVSWPSIVPYWSNNSGYIQNSIVPLGFWLDRVGLPFSEPSYASAYLAATTLGLWAVTLLGRGWWWAVLAALVSSLGLVNSLGSTGLAAGGLAMVVLFLWILFNALRPATCLSVRLRAAVMCVLLLLASTWGYQVYSVAPAKPKLEAMVNGLILDKVKLKDGSRELSNKRALEIVQETYGLGVGMGSNRASSFFASLVSNTGVLGAALFCAMLVSLLWRYVRAPALTDMQIFVAVALPTATLAMGLGIPDLNLPMYWGFIFLAFVFCPGDAGNGTTKT
jgi:hypothetical protein